MWLTTDGELHEDKSCAKAKQKRLNDVRTINEKIKAGEMLGPLFGSHYEIFDNVNTDTDIVIHCYPQYKYHVEEMLVDGQLILRLQHFTQEKVIMSKHELSFYMNHPINQPT